MSRFKVGDKVRFVGNKEPLTIKKVTPVFRTADYLVEYSNGDYDVVAEDEIEFDAKEDDSNE